MSAGNVGTGARFAIVHSEDAGDFPCVVVPGIGVYRAEIPGTLDRIDGDSPGHESAVAAWEAGQSNARLVRAGGPAGPFHDRFVGGTDAIDRPTADGRTRRMVYVGMGNWMTDLGPFTGPLPDTD